ncbi:MAG: hypothetical protein Q4C75_07615 [Bergeyella zoohelcum]|nr:hypothetical protein [Bergeyella zoohelcum]
MKRITITQLILIIVLLLALAIFQNYNFFYDLEKVFSESRMDKKVATYVGITLLNMLYLGALFYFLICLAIKITNKNKT